MLKEGKEAGQGVAYLDDGTMVVVDQGKRAIGRTIEVDGHERAADDRRQDDLLPVAGGPRRRRRGEPRATRAEPTGATPATAATTAASSGATATAADRPRSPRSRRSAGARRRAPARAGRGPTAGAAGGRARPTVGPERSRFYLVQVPLALALTAAYATAACLAALFDRSGRTTRRIGGCVGPRAAAAPRGGRAGVGAEHCPAGRPSTPRTTRARSTSSSSSATCPWTSASSTSSRSASSRSSAGPSALGGHVPIDRRNPFRARKSLERAARRIRGGDERRRLPRGHPQPRRAPRRLQARQLPPGASRPACPWCRSRSSGVKAVVPRGAPSVAPGTVRVLVHPPMPSAGRDARGGRGARGGGAPSSVGCAGRAGRSREERGTPRIACAPDSCARARDGRRGRVGGTRPRRSGARPPTLAGAARTRPSTPSWRVPRFAPPSGASRCAASRPGARCTRAIRSAGVPARVRREARDDRRRARRLGPDARLRTTSRRPAGSTASGASSATSTSWAAATRTSRRASRGRATAASRRWPTRSSPAGVRRIEGRVVGHEGAFTGDRRGSDWTWEDLAWGYGAEVSALSFADNLVRRRLAPGEREGDPAVLDVDPDRLRRRLIAVDLDEAAPTAPAPPPRGRFASLRREPGSDAVRLSGPLPIGGEWERRAGGEDPARCAAARFARALEAKGIRVTGGVATAREPLPAGARVLAAHEVATMAEMVRVVNKESQNLHAEMLLRLVGLKAEGEGSGRVGMGGRCVPEQARRAARRLGARGRLRPRPAPTSSPRAASSPSSRRWTATRARPRSATRCRWPAVDGTLEKRMRGTAGRGARAGEDGDAAARQRARRIRHDAARRAARLRGRRQQPRRGRLRIRWPCARRTASLLAAQ